MERPRNVVAPPDNVGPIEKLCTLAEEFKHNTDFKKKVDSLLHDGYHSWRRIRGDGNCFYRAVGFGLLEWFASSHSRSSRAKVAAAWHEKLREIDFALAPEIARRDRLLRHLEHISDSGNDGESAVSSLQAAFVDPDGWADSALVSSLRSITAKFLMRNVSNQEIGNGLTLGECIRAEGFADMESFCLERVFPEGIEAEGIIQNVLPLILGIRLHIVFLDREAMAGSRVPSVSFGKEQGPEIFVQFRPGHYDLIYHSSVYASASSGSALGKEPDHQKITRVELKATHGYHNATPQRPPGTYVSTPTPEKTCKVMPKETVPLSVDVFPEGTPVEYFCPQARDWIPAFVRSFDRSSCLYSLDVEDKVHPSKVRRRDAVAGGTVLLQNRAQQKDKVLLPPTSTAPKSVPKSTSAVLFPAGAAVEYFSERAGCWIPAVVQDFSEATQTYVLDVQPVAIKSKVRASAMTDVSNGSSHKQVYETGAQVEYYSKSAGAWIPAIVQGFSKESGTYMLDRQPVAYPAKIRAVPACRSFPPMQTEVVDEQRSAFVPSSDLRQTRERRTTAHNNAFGSM